MTVSRTGRARHLEALPTCHQCPSNAYQDQEDHTAHVPSSCFHHHGSSIMLPSSADGSKQAKIVALKVAPQNATPSQGVSVSRIPFPSSELTPPLRSVPMPWQRKDMTKVGTQPPPPEEYKYNTSVLPLHKRGKKLQKRETSAAEVAYVPVSHRDNPRPSLPLPSPPPRSCLEKFQK